jgi:DNA helicase IV
MCSTIFAFKGLERDVVIFVEPDKIQSNTEREQLIYVALSRARFHLIIVGNLLT